MKCAYVTLVMLGNNYVKGAVALAKSLKNTGTEFDLVCLVTPDVTKIEDLKKLYTRVIFISYLYQKCGKMLTQRQHELYSKWIDFSFTKWRCFELTDYDKCIFLDADQIVLKNIDHLINIPARYALCHNPNYNSHFKRFNHADIITYKELEFMYDNFDLLGFTGTLVFTPDLSLSQHIFSILHNNSLVHLPNRFNNGYDEVVLTRAFIDLKIDVVQLDPQYTWNAGNYTALKNNHMPFVVNYYGDQKPWCEKVLFLDVFIWKYFYHK
ncbi:P13 [Diatraea saccharalis granulovirus]|uniref:p13 n=1 Tax=Diatraea saccharalis granulovirus TaxID=1675862 RepID=A0A0R7EYR7_9BBAC|nr:P13 [Diatraea saccharalis granulovirus]AKN80719.1 P13 [Diatraea saccharalis granulovirus]